MWVAAAQLGAVCALCLSLLTATHAAPLVLQDGFQQADTSTFTRAPVIPESDPLPVDDAQVWPAATGAALTKPEAARTAERSLPAPPAGPMTLERPAATPNAAQGQPQANADVDGSIHSAVKESVRPVYEQLVESGALAALHDLKADLGLNKHQWSDQEKTDATVKGPGRWDASSGQDPAAPPRTAAQAQLDRETASMMREKLIDQITPWLIGLVVLYAVGYLARLLYRYLRWKSAKRSKQRIARAQRHASRRSRSSSRATTSTSSAPQHATVESQETV